MSKSSSVLGPILNKIKSSKFFIFQYLFVIFLVVTFLFVGWKSTPKENLTGSKKIISSPSKQITPEPYSKFININEASLEELDTLIGIGLVTAQKIIDNRTYESINDLLDKKVISKTVFEKIKSKIII